MHRARLVGQTCEDGLDGGSRNRREGRQPAKAVPMLSSLAVVAPDPPLAADGVVLRETNDGDAAWITKAWNDPDIARFIVATPSPFAQRWASGTDAEFVIADAASGEPLGLISLRVAERDPGLAAVGYW